jgi:hypothetical protein
MSKTKRAGAVGAVVMATVVSVLLVQVAIARVANPDSVTANGSLHQTKVARSNDEVNRSSSSWSNVHGMSMTVNASGKSLILITFSAESTCYNAGDTNWCSVRARVGSKSAQPDEGIDFAWQGGTSVDPYESLAMTRSIIVGGGNHTVTIQMNANSNDFRLDDMSLVVQVIDV